jgi:hypothetical protein
MIRILYKKPRHFTRLLRNPEMKKSCLGLLAIIGLTAHTGYAQKNQRHDFGAPLRAPAVITKQANTNSSTSLVNGLRAAPLQTADVYLMNISLTNAQKLKFATFKTTDNLLASENTESKKGLPSKIDLGMNNVPVLDQGMHGTCVTFAITAAIDALLNQGDYVSQLCSLALGSSLEYTSYFPSGWDGSYGIALLDRLTEYGIVSVANQKAHSCGQFTDYPVNDFRTSGPMSASDYHQISEDINMRISWYSLITEQELFSENAPADVTDRLLTSIKQTLNRPYAQQDLRLTVGLVLPVNHCHVGACATYHKTDDTWALTKEIIKDNEPEYGGHEMVITGYDDHAVAVDNTGAKHKGLLILRNSWGDKYGDNGNFYVTYDFFKQFVLDVQVIEKGG